MEKEQLIIKRKRAKGDDGYKVFSIRVREEIVSEIDKIAARTGRSRNELIGIFLRYSLQNCVIEDSNEEDQTKP